jgi:hypothetical protein
MNTFQLVTRHLYFGVDAMRLRTAAERVLTRVHGQPPDRAVIGLDTLAQDFRVSPRESLSIVDQMVQGGLLEPKQSGTAEYAITDKFRQYAQARIVDPLPRSRAQLLLTHIADLAEHFNRTALRNKYEIEALGVYGAYMSREPELPDLLIGVTGRRRESDSRRLAGRVTGPSSGHEQIRKMFEELSSFVQVTFYRHLQDIPRPFSVFFRSEG